MARAKRNSSPSNSIEAGPSKRRRQNPPPEPTNEVIEISSDEDDPPASVKPPLKGKEKGKAKAKVYEFSDSEIEIIEKPAAVSKRVKSKPKPRSKVKPKTSATVFVQDDDVVLNDVVEDVDWYAEDVILDTVDAGLGLLHEVGGLVPEPGIGVTSSANGLHDLAETKEVARRAGDSSSGVQQNTLTYKANTKSAVNLEIPRVKLPNPEHGVAEFKELLSRVGTCSRCKAELASPSGQVDISRDESFQRTFGELLHATCPSKSCRGAYCRGCSKPLSCASQCPGPSGNPSCSALTCCTEGRAVALFEVLAGFDVQYLLEKETSDSRTKETLKKFKRMGAGSVGPGGTGYGTGNYHAQPHYHFHGTGTGRGRGRGRGRGGAASSSRPELIPLQQRTSIDYAARWDQTVSRALTSIRDLLPSPCSETPEIYDLLPHPSLSALILMSYVPTVLAQLLRNDSVTDWIARSHVYHAMLSLLRRMSDSELIIRVLVGSRYEISQSPGLGAWMRDEGEIVWQRDSTGAIELAPPLLEHFKKLTKQSETFLQAASQQLGDDGGGDEEGGLIDGLSLCGDIIAGRDDIARAMGIIGSFGSSEGDEDVDVDVPQATNSNGVTTRGRGKGKGKGKQKAPPNTEAFDVEKGYISACEKLAFEHTALGTDGPDGLVYANYNYFGQLKATQNQTRIPKDRLHLAKELAVMATSLPPGIWVRVDEVRNDAIKVMIAGPQGTPYAGGLFEFDVFMPLQYPNSPPLVHLRTTGRGTVRFNPNLYQCGKVCLSLLGTWPGSPEEQWTNKSTLLQVLVSIQSMILNEAPYFNEPGHGKVNLNSQASIAYNRNTAVQTVRWAMIEWLKEEHRHGLWGGVIKSHFTTLEEKIRKQILEWANDIPAIRNYPSSMNSGARYDPYWGMPSLAPIQNPFIQGSSGVNGSGYLSAMASLPSMHATGPTKGATITGRNPEPPKAGMDLVHEFEEGMKRVQEWGCKDD